MDQIFINLDKTADEVGLRINENIWWPEVSKIIKLWKLQGASHVQRTDDTRTSKRVFKERNSWTWSLDVDNWKKNINKVKVRNGLWSLEDDDVIRNIYRAKFTFAALSKSWKCNYVSANICTIIS